MRGHSSHGWAWALLAVFAGGVPPTFCAQELVRIERGAVAPDGAADYRFRITSAGDWTLWAPTPGAVRPVQFWMVRAALTTTLPYTWSLDGGEAQEGRPHFPRLLGKSWPTWCQLAVVRRPEGEHVLQLCPTGKEPGLLPASLVATNTDFIPMADLDPRPGDVWVEGEVATHNFVVDEGLPFWTAPVMDLEPRFGEAGGQVLVLATTRKPPADGYHAQWDLRTATGRYDVWVHSYAPNGKGWWASPPHSPYRWALDGGPLQEWGTELPEGRPLIYTSQQGGWYLLGAADLAAGNHMLRLQIDQPVAGSPQYQQAIDCLLLRRDGGGALEAVPPDVTASRRLCLRLAGVDSTNLFDTTESCVPRIALDRRKSAAREDSTIVPDYKPAETFALSWELVDQDDHRQTGRGELRFGPGELTQSLALPQLTRLGWYRIAATLEQSGQRIGAMKTAFGVVPPRRFKGRMEDGYFGAAQGSVRYDVGEKIGVKWARLEAEWALIESQPGQFNWTEVDRQVADAERYQVCPIMTLRTTAMWGSTAPESVTGWDRVNYPPQIEPWKKFVRAVAERYRGRVRCYELWNEPWVQGYCWKAGSQEYADLTRATFQALQEADPQARLGAYEWPHDLYQRGLGDSFAAIAIHPYADPPPEKGFLNWLTAWCPPALARKHEVWLTEHAWYLDPNQMDEQANFVVRSLAMGLGFGVTHYLYFDLDGWTLGEPGRLMEDDGSPRPGLITYAVCERMLEGTTSVGRVGRGDENFCWIYQPRQGNGGVACAWSLAEKPPAVALPAGLEAFDRFGNPIPRGQVKLSGAPIYVQGADLAALQAALKQAFDPPRRFTVLRDYQVCGPFDNPRYENLRYGLFTDYTPDQRVNLRDRMAGVGRGWLRWKPASAREDGVLDFLKVCGVLDNVVAYAACWVWSPGERDTELMIGSDDGARVRLNGQIIFSHLTERGVYPDDDNQEKDYLPITLQKGWNEFLFKVEQAIGGWGLQVKILDPQGDLRLAGRPPRVRLSGK